METTHLPARSTAGSGGLLAALRRHPLIGYFVLAYVVTWLLWLPGCCSACPNLCPPSSPTYQAVRSALPGWPS